MDYKAIINLMKEMNNTDLTKLEIEEEGFRICIEKAVEIVTVTQAAPSAIPYTPISSVPLQGVNPVQAVPATGTAQVPAAAPAADATDVAEDNNYKKLVSPMVGTFYAAPGPDKPPFVKVGDKVKKGQTICIIEAMKLMNEIESEHDGEIVKILVNNEDMVEFGQPMFLVK